jgi:nucleotide-binding universal stress UspA family protein
MNAMYRHLLLATDGSELAQKAVAQGLDLAKALQARVTAVTIIEPVPAMVSGDASFVAQLQEYDRAATAHATRILDALTATAKIAGVTCEVVHVKDQYPAQGILETAKAKGADLIVMASHGRRGISKLLLGSQATEVVSQSSVPVLVYRE